MVLQTSTVPKGSFLCNVATSRRNRLPTFWGSVVISSLMVETSYNNILDFLWGITVRMRDRLFRYKMASVSDTSFASILMTNIPSTVTTKCWWMPIPRQRAIQLRWYVSILQLISFFFPQSNFYPIVEAVENYFRAWSHAVKRPPPPTHTHIRDNSSGRVIRPSQRPLTAQHTTSTTDIHAPGGIRTRNPIKRASADLCLRGRGHWDRRRYSYQTKLHNNGNFSFNYFVLWPTKARLFHKLSYTYMFRHCRVILRQLVINTLPSYTSISNAAVGNTIYN